MCVCVGVCVWLPSIWWWRRLNGEEERISREGGASDRGERVRRGRVERGRERLVGGRRDGGGKRLKMTEL